MARLTKAARDLRNRLKPPPPVLTQKQLAEKLGVSQQAVSAWLHGIARPDPERMAEIEKLLGIPMRDWTELAADDSGEHSAIDADSTDVA